MSGEARLVIMTVVTATIIGYLAVKLAVWDAERRMG